MLKRGSSQYKQNQRFPTCWNYQTRTLNDNDTNTKGVMVKVKNMHEKMRNLNTEIGTIKYSQTWIEEQI